MGLLTIYRISWCVGISVLHKWILQKYALWRKVFTNSEPFLHRIFFNWMKSRNFFFHSNVKAAHGRHRLIDLCFILTWIFVSCHVHVVVTDFKIQWKKNVYCVFLISGICWPHFIGLNWWQVQNGYPKYTKCSNKYSSRVYISILLTQLLIWFKLFYALIKT